MNSIESNEYKRKMRQFIINLFDSNEVYNQFDFDTTLFFSLIVADERNLREQLIIYSDENMAKKCSYHQIWNCCMRIS